MAKNMKPKPELRKIQEQNRLRLQKDGASPELITEFLRRIERVDSGATGKIKWDTVSDLKKEDYVPLGDLPSHTSSSSCFSKLAVIKLNGGLGTSMGLDRAKSLLPVYRGQSFMQIFCRQIEYLRQRTQVCFPTLLMNSFVTRKDTLEESCVRELNRNTVGNIPFDFLQNRIPRICRDSLLPLEGVPEKEQWCPPGHGDVFWALQSSGLLEKLIQNGVRVAFISNGDNLGAVPEPRILEYFLKEGLEWISELTPKTIADIKGGILYRRIESRTSPPANVPPAKIGSIDLLETAQIPKEYIPEFQDIKRFPYFNVNNLWVNLEALKERLESQTLNLPLIVNPKQIAGKEILQLETAMGAAIGCFSNSRILVVPRSRFLPVKNCSDLLLRRSDLFGLHPETAEFSSPRLEQGKQEPAIVLDQCYQRLPDFENLFPYIPSLREASRLEVRGRVCFDIPVKIQGKVCFESERSDQGPPASLKQTGKTVFKDETVRIQ